MICAASALIGVGTLLHVALADSMLVGYWQHPKAPLAKHLRAVEAWSPVPNVLTLLVLLLPALVIAFAFVPGVAWLRARHVNPAAPT